mmetsp:Transcript_22357/g.41897  ORF Transcript_22357/g.41897 Transcript_22357/m.41897 type:complete len:436 (+) Transcript_22357:83-1390(+)
MGTGRERVVAESSDEFLMRYYERVLGEEEFRQECRWLRQSLPVTFRVNASRPRARLALEELQRTNEVKRLEWCDAWQLLEGNVMDIKNCWPGSSLHAWRRWLANMQADGTIERQEAVSMIPVRVLDVRPGHFVLDMCASPGSKTAQVLDALAVGKGGFIVANELDQKRARVLVRRLRGLGDTANKRVAVISHNAKTVPRFTAGFDRIVCDVPCSGDGTLRKNRGLWNHWIPHYGLQLHSTQVQIAMRGLSLLKQEGLMVYSTCSFNPIEDEAVVAAVLAKCKGSVVLENCSSRLGGLPVRKGLRAWDVVDDTGMIFKTFKQAVTRSKPKSCRQRFRPTMWPSNDPSVLQQLENCVRVMPSARNTGGFFVALFRKIDSLPREEASKDKPVIAAKQALKEPPTLRADWRVSKELKKGILETPGLRLVAAGAPPKDTD